MDCKTEWHANHCDTAGQRYDWQHLPHSLHDGIHFTIVKWAIHSRSMEYHSSYYIYIKWNYRDRKLRHVDCYNCNNCCYIQVIWRGPRTITATVGVTPLTTSTLRQSLLDYPITVVWISTRTTSQSGIKMAPTPPLCSRRGLSLW